MLFAKSDIVHKISDVDTCQVTTGFKGVSGNKGGAGLYFQFDNSTFLFMDCHFESGQKKIKDRIENAKYIYDSCLEQLKDLFWHGEKN